MAESEAYKKVSRELNDYKGRYQALVKTSKQNEIHARMVARYLLLRQEEDRKEISRELHDQVAQILSGINFELSILSKEAEKSSKKLRDKIVLTQQLVGESVEFIHHFARELRPMVLDDLGLIPALQSYLKDFERQHSIQVKFKHPRRSIKLSDLSNTVLFRVVQEALANVAKHSKATRVSIQVRKLRDFVTLEVNDNGGGFNFRAVKFSKKKGTRLGLIGMEERVRLADGQLTLKSTPGEGTWIQVRIPITQEDSR